MSLPVCSSPWIPARGRASTRISACASIGAWTPANLFVAPVSRPSWAKALQETYLSEYPRSLALQSAPLVCEDLEMLLKNLRSWGPKCFSLAADILEGEAESRLAAWERDKPRADSLIQQARDTVGPARSARGH